MDRTAPAACWSLAEREDRYVQVDGVRVRYWDLGAGAPVVLVHGLGASLETWLPNVDALAARHRVLPLDLPGFGRSGTRAGLVYSARSAAEFLAAILDRLGVGRASVAGNSLGGLVALQLALDYPEKVDRLVLVGSAGLGREIALPLRLASLPLLGGYLFSRIAPEAMVRDTVSSALSNGGELPPELVERWIEMASTPGAMATCLRSLRAGVTLFGQRREIVLRDRLGELHAPTLLVWGDRDPVVPVAHAYAAHRALPGSRLHVFPGARHCPQLERPAEFNELLLDFLAG